MIYRQAKSKDCTGVFIQGLRQREFEPTQNTKKITDKGFSQGRNFIIQIA